MNSIEWNAMKNMAVTEIDSSKLIDRRNIENNASLPKTERIKNNLGIP